MRSAFVFTPVVRGVVCLTPVCGPALREPRKLTISNHDNKLTVEQQHDHSGSRWLTTSSGNSENNKTTPSHAQRARYHTTDKHVRANATEVFANYSKQTKRLADSNAYRTTQRQTKPSFRMKYAQLFNTLILIHAIPSHYYSRGVPADCRASPLPRPRPRRFPSALGARRLLLLRPIG